MTSRPALGIVLTTLGLLVAHPLFADGAMKAYAPNAPLSPEKLERITDYFNNEVKTAKISSAVVLIQRHGAPVYLKSFGTIDTIKNEPMTPDAIFRIHSMSKPITSVAAMMLVDDGKLKVSDPVSKYIPSFADVRVGVETKADNGDPVLRLVPSVRPLTIADLLTHSAGIPYGFYGKGLVRYAYGDADLFANGIDNKLLAEKIALLPLAEQPGTKWDYGHSTDLLGRVIEVVSGTSLYDFEKQRLFDPFGMKDTAYYVKDPAQHHRIAEPLPSDNDFRSGNARNPRVYDRWESGGGGLVTTMGDFARFAQMILNGGKLDGRRYLSRKTFDEMVANRVTPKMYGKRDQYYFPGDGFGFSYGFGVRVAPGEATPPAPGSLGELKWDGAGGTYFFIDRAQDMFAVLLIQSPSERGRIQPAFKKMVYDAFEK